MSYILSEFGICFRCFFGSATLINNWIHCVQLFFSSVSIIPLPFQRFWFYLFICSVAFVCFYFFFFFLEDFFKLASSSKYHASLININRLKQSIGYWLIFHNRWDSMVFTCVLIYSLSIDVQMNFNVSIDMEEITHKSNEFNKNKSTTQLINKINLEWR